MGLLTGPQLWAFLTSCRGAGGMGRGPARAVAGGRDGGQLVRVGARGHVCPSARRGRDRPKSLLENLFAESGDASACSRAERGVSLR
jgi:hypothetical protein